jgi:hypothetical protein
MEIFVNIFLEKEGLFPQGCRKNFHKVHNIPRPNPRRVCYNGGIHPSHPPDIPQRRPLIMHIPAILRNALTAAAVVLTVGLALTA